jgi:hypothetical protein
MVGKVGVAKKKGNKLSIFISYNPFLLTNGIIPKANPSLLMLTTSKLSGKRKVTTMIFLYSIVFTLNYRWLQILS